MVQALAPGGCGQSRTKLRAAYQLPYLIRRAPLGTEDRVPYVHRYSNGLANRLTGVRDVIWSRTCQNGHDAAPHLLAFKPSLPSVTGWSSERAAQLAGADCSRHPIHALGLSDRFSVNKRDKGYIHYNKLHVAILVHEGHSTP